jgi:hypothetical protein
MKKGLSWIEIAYSSIHVFADDGTIDMEELNFLLGLAIKDGKIDADEKRVLRNVFDEVKEHDLSPKVRARIDEIKKKHEL